MVPNDDTNDSVDPINLAMLTTEIVSAYVAHNTIATSDLPVVISTVAARLSTLGTDTLEETKLKPAVPIRKSVRQDDIVCLVCGQAQKLLKRHLATRHNLTPDDYRAMFELPAKYPMTAPAYAEMRSALAKKAGLGRKAKSGKKSKRKTVARKR